MIPAKWRLLEPGERLQAGDESYNPLAVDGVQDWLPLTLEDLKLWTGSGLPIRRQMTAAEAHAELLAVSLKNLTDSILIAAERRSA